MGVFNQPVEYFRTLDSSQIKRQRTFIEVETLEIQALALAQPVRANLTRGIATFGGFNLDYVGTELSKEHRAVWAGTVLLSTQDAVASKRECAFAQSPSP